MKYLIEYTINWTFKEKVLWQYQPTSKGVPHFIGDLQGLILQGAAYSSLMLTWFESRGVLWCAKHEEIKLELQVSVKNTILHIFCFCFI